MNYPKESVFTGELSIRDRVWRQHAIVKNIIMLYIILSLLISLVKPALVLPPQASTVLPL